MFKLSDKAIEKLSNMYTIKEMNFTTTKDDENFVAMGSCSRQSCSNQCDGSCYGTCTWTCHHRNR